MIPIKVCGMTRVEDIDLAVSLGAWAIGIVHHPASPRHQTLDQVKHLLTHTSEHHAVVKVVVTVNPEPELVEGLVYSGANYVQLHGDESIEFCSRYSGSVIKAISLRTPEDISMALRYPHGYMIVDAASNRARGGTGELADWSLVADLASKRNQVILAGGINPDNLKEAWTTVKPWGIDLASGVELSPGIKDPQKLQSLFAQGESDEPA